MSEEVGGVLKVLRKLRKREPMSDDELALAKQAVADRGSLMAYLHPRDYLRPRLLLRLRQP